MGKYLGAAMQKGGSMQGHGGLGKWGGQLATSVATGSIKFTKWLTCVWNCLISTCLNLSARFWAFLLKEVCDKLFK